MCTALTLTVNSHYFGRNLDLDRSYGEEISITPRRFPIKLKQNKNVLEHYAFIGMSTVAGGVPLYYDAANEYGLCMAGLNFPNNAHYKEIESDKYNIAPFELIPWVLAQCKTVNEATGLLKNTNVVNIPFSEKLPLTPLHFIISDRNKTVTAEPMTDGLQIYDNPVGVLTNNPPFPYQLANLKKYKSLQTTNPLLCDIPKEYYCQGLGGVGLPGDVSSMSRFVRAAFAKQNSVCDGSEYSSVGQFFHLLDFVKMPRGIVKTESGQLDITVYSSCMNADKGLYYYKTYDNSQINCINMHKTDLNSDKITHYPLVTNQQIHYQN